MADRTWITVFFPTPLIFRYNLPLSNVSPLQHVVYFSRVLLPPVIIFNGLYLKGQCHEIFCLSFFSWIIFLQTPGETDPCRKPEVENLVALSL
jgi:hypothetical protein